MESLGYTEPEETKASYDENKDANQKMS